MLKYIWLFAWLLFQFGWSQGLPPGEACKVVFQHNPKMLLGEVPIDTLFHYFPEWDSLYQEYQVDSTVLNQLKKIDIDYDIVCFFGTWCSDSRDGVPSFLKALDLAKNPHLRLRLFALDRKMDDPKHLGPVYGIERVPTFIIFKDGKEIGRMVEIPLVSFEADFVQIIQPKE